MAAIGLVASSVLLSACAMQVSTLPNVTVGNTGCPSDESVVFNYEASRRSWQSMCGDSFFVCSDVGHRTARCSPDRESVQDSEIRLRASLLRQLPAERRIAAISGDIRDGELDDFVQKLRILASMNDQDASEIEHLNEILLGVPDDTLGRLRECRDREVARLRVTSGRGGSVHFSSNVSCWSRNLNEVEFDPSRFSDVTHVYVFLGEVDPTLVSIEVQADSSPDVQEPVPAPASGGSGPDLDTQMRGLLNERRADILACVDADRAVVRLSRHIDGEVVVALNGSAGGSPEEGCVRSVLSSIEWPTSNQTAEIIHLVQADDPGTD